MGNKKKGNYMEKNGISLEVKLIADGVDEDGNPVVAGLFDAIVAEASSSLEARISKRVDSLLESKFTQFAMEIVREKVGAIVDAFLANPIFPTDKYGQPKGDPTTLAEEIQKQLNQYLVEKVNPRDGSDDRWSDKNVPRIVWAARKAAADLSESAIKEHLSILRKEFTDHLTDRIAAAAIK